MIFDTNRYRELRTRHGVYTSATLAIHPGWFLFGAAVTGAVIGVLL
jgi:hypothetical protein